MDYLLSQDVQLQGIKGDWDLHFVFVASIFSLP